MTPRPLDDEPGLFLVDATWGNIQPIELAPDVRTVGELELIAHLRAGLPLIDTRHGHQFAHATIPGARSLPHTDLPERIDELDLATQQSCSVTVRNAPPRPPRSRRCWRPGIPLK